MLSRFISWGVLLLLSQLAAWAAETSPTVVISVPDQKLVVIRNGLPAAAYPVSTSRFGLGDRPRSYSTPLGVLEIAAKIGGGAPLGSVFKCCRPTGEVIAPNARGRDPIVTRILRLRGLEAQNAGAYNRGIYIHGTPQERLIGRPASYGCIRMRSQDVIALYNSLNIGAKVEILNQSLSKILHEVAAN